jgi:hypothetical protein
MLLPDSTWWTDNSLFSDKVSPSDWLTEEEQAEIIQSIGVQNLLDELQYKKYQMYLQMAGRIAQSFGGINFVFDYLQDQKNPDLKLEDVISNFTEKFTDYIHNTDDDQIYKLVDFIKDYNKIYVSKIEFLQMLLPDSTWWADNSLFSDKVSPSDVLTQKEQAEIIQSTGVQNLLDELQYKKYQMYLQMAERIAQSFGGINFVFDYLQDQKNPDLKLEDVISNFTEKFTTYIHNTDDDQAYYLVPFIKDNEKKYVSKIEFLNMLLPDSTWWADNSLFSDKVSPSDWLTEEEQAEIIQSIGVQNLLDELQ